jgi:membrane protease YdiL (CAAX protease family)
MIVFFVSRIVCVLILSYVAENLVGALGMTAAYILHLGLSGVFLYVIPIICAWIIFKDENRQGLSALYRKPPRLAKALGNFPAMYGLGQITNMLMLLIVWVISRLQTSGVEQETLERSFGTMNSMVPPNMIAGIVLFLHMVFAAAIFEELLCRGILLNAARPYGNGFAIIVTGFLFGIMHGNFHQFVYTFVLGIVLAYITIQTGSILAATILHAMFNSIAAVMMLFLSTQTIQEQLFSPPIPPEQAQPASDSAMLLLAGFGMYFALFLVLLIAGMALAVRRLLQIRSYGSGAALKNAQALPAELSAKRRLLIFAASVPVLITVAFTADAFAGGFLAQTIYGALR